MKCSGKEDLFEVKYVDNHLLVALKPCGLLTQPNDTDSPNLEDLVKAWLKKEYQKKGNVFLHPIHRLDKPVSGLVLFARTSKALSRLQKEMREKKIVRIYYALVEGKMQKEGTLRHFLIHGNLDRPRFHGISSKRLAL